MTQIGDPDWLSANETLKRVSGIVGGTGKAKASIANWLFGDNAPTIRCAFLRRDLALGNIPAEPNKKALEAGATRRQSIARGKQGYIDCVLMPAIWRYSHNPRGDRALWDWDKGIFVVIERPYPTVKYEAGSVTPIYRPSYQMIFYGVHFFADDVAEFSNTLSKIFMHKKTKTVVKAVRKKRILDQSTHWDWKIVEKHFDDLMNSGNFYTLFNPVERRGKKTLIQEHILYQCALQCEEPPSKSTLQRQRDAILGRWKAFLAEKPVDQMNQADPMERP